MKPQGMVKTPGGMLFVRNFFESVAFYIIFEYTKNEPMACRSSRPEYDERVCLTSAGDGVLQSVEYRLHVRRACRTASSSFLERNANYETCYNK